VPPLTRKRRLASVVIVLPGLLLRLSIPAGVMLGPGGLVLCPGVTASMPGMSMPNMDMSDPGHGPPPHDSHPDVCPFAASAAGFSPPPAPATLATFVEVVVWSAAGPAAPARFISPTFQPQSARGPPTFSSTLS
jgi:hypothetical protein